MTACSLAAAARTRQGARMGPPPIRRATTDTRTCHRPATFAAPGARSMVKLQWCAPDLAVPDNVAATLFMPPDARGQPRPAAAMRWLRPRSELIVGPHLEAHLRPQIETGRRPPRHQEFAGQTAENSSSASLSVSRRTLSRAPMQRDLPRIPLSGRAGHERKQESKGFPAPRDQP